jgi:hypothetical protein
MQENQTGPNKWNQGKPRRANWHGMAEPTEARKASRTNVVVVVDLFNLPVGLFRFKLQYYALKLTIYSNVKSIL